MTVATEQTRPRHKIGALRRAVEADARERNPAPASATIIDRRYNFRKHHATA
jgi:hypothetical protein